MLFSGWVPAFAAMTSQASIAPSPAALTGARPAAPRLLASVPVGDNRMRFRLPEALHGWREFLKDYAIVVLGVLTALALDQLVQSAHERRLARDAHEAIDQELQTDLDRVAYRARQQSCNVKRLEEIQALLARWRDDGAFPAGLKIGFPGDVGLVDQRWQANLASGRFSEESPQEQTDQAGLYTLIHVIDMVENKEIYE